MTVMATEAAEVLAVTGSEAVRPNRYRPEEGSDPAARVTVGVWLALKEAGSRQGRPYKAPVGAHTPFP